MTGGMGNASGSFARSWLPSAREWDTLLSFHSALQSKMAIALADQAGRPSRDSVLRLGVSLLVDTFALRALICSYIRGGIWGFG